MKYKGGVIVRANPYAASFTVAALRLASDVVGQAFMLRRTQVVSTTAVGLLLLLAAACSDQSTVPPTVRLTYTSGNMSGTVSNTDELLLQHVGSNKSITFEADGYSSVAGMKSIQIIPGASFTCQRGNIAVQGTPDFAPVMNMPLPSTPVPAQLSVTFAFEAPSSNCQESFALAGWSGSVSAIATALNGEQASSQPINLTSP